MHSISDASSSAGILLLLLLLLALPRRRRVTRTGAGTTERQATSSRREKRSSCGRSARTALVRSRTPARWSARSWAPRCRCPAGETDGNVASAFHARAAIQQLKEHSYPHEHPIGDGGRVHFQDDAADAIAPVRRERPTHSQTSTAASRPAYPPSTTSSSVSSTSSMLSSITWRSIRFLDHAQATGGIVQYIKRKAIARRPTHLSRLLTVSNAASSTFSRISSFCSVSQSRQ
jgi:MYXO-CTERM domain-containing protein